MSNYSVRTASIALGRYIKIFGYGTFSLRDDIVTVTVFDFLCLSFNLTIGFLVFYLSMCYGVERLSQVSILLAIGIVITMVSASLVSITSMLIVFWNRHRIWEIVVILDNVMTKFIQINVRRSFSRHFTVIAIFALVSISCVIFGLLVMFFWLGYSSKIGILIVYGYLSINFAVSMGWSALFHVAIYSRLKLVNELISDLFLSDRTSKTMKVLPAPAECESTILLFKSIHHDLMRCVKMVNIAFGFQTMLCFAITFLFTLFTSFASYKVFFYHDTAITLSQSSIYWCIFYNCFQACIIFTCQLVDFETEFLSTLIYKMMNRKTCSLLTLEAFGNQVQQISGKSSCGLFHFDYSLIMMVSV